MQIYLCRVLQEHFYRVDVASLIVCGVLLLLYIVGFYSRSNDSIGRAGRLGGKLLFYSLRGAVGVVNVFF